MRPPASILTALGAAFTLVLATAAPASAGDARGLAWAPCPDAELAAWQCATLTVSKSPGDAAAGAFTLSVVRLPATGPRIGSLLFNPGGPGAASVDQAPQIASLLPPDLRRRFDLVTWDVRGVGRSEPLLGCAPATMALPATGPVDWSAALRSARAAQRQANTTCARRNASSVPYLGTAATVRDVEELRQALGEPRLSFWAVSAGTRIAAAYADAHPDRVRAFVLSGVVSPRSGITDWARSTATGVDDALDMLFDVSPATRDQAGRVMATLSQHPLELPSGATVSRWTVGVLATAIKGMNTGMPLVAGVFADLDAALHGTGASREQALARLDALPAIPADALPLSDPTASVIQCLDAADRPSPAEQSAILTRAVRRGPMAGWLTIANLTQCTGITTRPDPVPPIDLRGTSVPVLLVNATRDPNTPIRWADAMAEAIPSSRVIRYVGTTHGPFLSVPSACIDRVGVGFLVTGRLPRRDVTCRFVRPALSP